MSFGDKSMGVLEAAVGEHHPSSTVLFEARALDHELRARQRSWDVLLNGIHSFSEYYPAILLRSVEALRALTEACLEAIEMAPGTRDRARSAALMIGLLRSVVEESLREGPASVDREIPRLAGEVLAKMKPARLGGAEHALLFNDLLELGRRVLLVGEDGNPPEAWFSLLKVIASLSLDLVMVKIKGEPFYDGRWDEETSSRALKTSLLGAVRQERIEADLEWIGHLVKDLDSGKRNAVDVFLELTAYDSRDERENAWREWFEQLSAAVSSSGIPAALLRDLGRGLAEWIREVSDRRFLGQLARVLRKSAADVAQANGEAGLITALDTFGAAVIDRFGAEAGRGEIDAVLEDLRQTVTALVERLLTSHNQSVLARAVEEANRIRIGPVVGAPYSGGDTAWNMEMACRLPGHASRLVAGLVTGFSLEDCLLREGRPEVHRPEGSSIETVQVSRALCALLLHPWPQELRFLVRAAVRVTPLSPFHLGSFTARAHLLALDPDNRAGFYLHDFKERLLSKTGPDEVSDVEKVLLFWRSGQLEAVQELITPESVTALEDEKEVRRLDSLRRIIESLQKHAPAQNKSGVEWLADLPQAFYDESTLVKVAGHPGYSPAAMSQLTHMLQLYRELAHKYGRGGRIAGKSGESHDAIVEHSNAMLERRREIIGRLWAGGEAAGMPPEECLDLFARDIDLMRLEEGLLERLAGKNYSVLGPDKLGGATSVLAHMLLQAELSGLGRGEFTELSGRLRSADRDAEDLPDILSRIAWLAAEERNDLAEKLQEHIRDSARRLFDNPLSRPAANYRELFDARRELGHERLADVLGEVLVDDLLSADGGLPLLEEFSLQLLHFIERYRRAGD